MSIFKPANSKLVYPDTNRNVLRNPDLRNLNQTRLSGSTLGDEMDYDDITIHRSWRSYHENEPSSVKYFLFEISQRNPGELEYSEKFYKAVRFIRLTRVPRYLRQSTAASGPNMVFEQMRDVLAAIREQGVLFINLIAKSPNLPLIFAYGVQGVGNTLEEAKHIADEAYAVLEMQLNGTYQQLMYQPINTSEGELLSRYQSEWNYVAMGRGIPMPAGSTLGSNSLLDGNRTDIEATNNQLESFIRGMVDRSFISTLVTVPLSPAQITLAWRNIAQKVSEVKSEIHGSRSVNAGVALPLVLGTSQGDSTGNTHSSGTSFGNSYVEGSNTSVAHGLTHTNAQGISQTMGDALNKTFSTGQSSTLTDSFSSGMSSTETQGLSVNQGINQNSTMTAGASMAAGNTNATNWNNNLSSTYGSSVTDSQGYNYGNVNGFTNTSSTASGDSYSSSNTNNQNSGVQGGLPIIGLGGTNSTGTSDGTVSGISSTSGTSNANSNSDSSGISASRAAGMNQNISLGETLGGSQSLALTNTQSLSNAQSVGLSQGIGSNQSYALASSSTAGQSLANGQSLSQAQGLTSSNTLGNSSTNSEAQSLQNSSGNSKSFSNNQGINDSYAVALSKTQSATGSLAVAPNVGVTISRQTYDAAKDTISKILEAQMNRYNEGIKSGAFMYQLFLVAPDRHTLVGGAGLLKSAFWGSGQANSQLPQPFHTIVDFNEDENRRLLDHARVFTSYRKSEHRSEFIEPFLYSTFVTPSEAASFSHPPTAEGPGLLATVDSMPVMRIPSDRNDCDIPLGYVVNGERAVVSDIGFGINVEELTHTLIAGTTGSGKTSTLMKLLSEVAKIEKEIIEPPTINNPYPKTKKVRASILALDWMKNMRDLGSMPSLVASGRFKFYSLMKPELGSFKYNPLAIPCEGISTSEWLNALADNFTAAFSLGEYGRSLIAECLTELYTINRLEPYFISKPVIDLLTGERIKEPVILDAIDIKDISEDLIQYDTYGKAYINAFTYPDLTNCVSMAHLAAVVYAKVEYAATTEGARIMGTAMRDRLQSLWRRMQYFAPGNQYNELLSCDVSPKERTTLRVEDLINPDKGLITVVEADGLDIEARRLILGTLLLSIFRYGLHKGNGTFDHNGKGPGCFVVMEESHELFGSTDKGEDQFTIAKRTEIFEGMFRRARASGLRLIAVAQQPSKLPDAVTANVSTVFIHKLRHSEDRDKAFSLLNWSNIMNQQVREYRYLGEMGVGFCIARLDAKDDYTDSAPVHFRTEQSFLNPISDATLLSYKN